MDIWVPEKFALALEQALERPGAKQKMSLHRLAKQVHNLLLDAAQRHYHCFSPDDVAYIMTYVQWLLRDLNQNGNGALQEIRQVYDHIYKVRTMEANSARRIRMLLHDRIKRYVQNLRQD